jgi:two-component system sensor histidine kinase BaeS
MLASVILVLAWMVGAATISATATGRWGNLGLPDAADAGRPRGLLVVGAATVIGCALTAVAYRRIRGPVPDLLVAAEQVARGDHEVVDVAVRGPRELRLLATTVNHMAAALVASDAERRRFLADVTHELRNPLAVLQSEIEAQLDGLHPRDDDHTASLLDETHRLGRLVDDLHTLALAGCGRLVIRPGHLSLGALVDAAVERHRAQARRRTVTLRSSIEPGLPDAWADEVRIGQVLDNLLANAIRHTPAGGDVLIEARSGLGAMVLCRVTDGGSGFGADHLSNAFERSTRPSDSGGSGLGLPIARELVRAQSGTIEAGNDPSSGGGASVTFTLPAGAR